MSNKFNIDDNDIKTLSDQVNTNESTAIPFILTMHMAYTNFKQFIQIAFYLS